MKKAIKGITVAIATLCSALLCLVTVFSLYMPNEFITSLTEKNVELQVMGLSVKNKENFQLAENNLIKEKSESGYLMLGNIIPIKDVDIKVTERRYLQPCGTPFGIKVFTNGAVVVKIDNITVNNKEYCPAKDAGIEIGDTITKANNKTISSNNDLIGCVKNCNGKELCLTIKRDNEIISKTLRPINTGNNNYKIGIWVRDSSAGIGTVTFYDSNTKCFAALGHGICDIDTNEILPLSQGDVVDAKIDGITKASNGSAGTLNGHHNGNAAIGKVTANKDTGVYGTMYNFKSQYNNLPVAFKQEVKTGAAQIIATLDDNQSNYYDIAIESINYDENSKTKNIVIKITDESLLSKTNGIVQGMSGSPIIQDNKLVGAVTHVFVNDPKRGYGIFAENMMLDFDKENQIQEEPAA